MINFSYFRDNILYHIFKIILIIFKKRHGEKTDNPWIRIYVNKIENKIKFKIKTGYYLELLIPETMKLLGHTKSKITKDENGKNFLHLEVTEVVLVHCNIFMIQESFIHLFLINRLVNYYIFTL